MSAGPAGDPERYPPAPRAVGEVPGYEFEGPYPPARELRAAGPVAPAGLADPLHDLRPPAAAARKPPSRAARVAGGALAVMRTRNWVAGLVLPILAAIIVGIAAVVVAGGSGGHGAAPSALDAGFPPARLAGTDFTGAGVAAPVVLAAIAAAGATVVVAGSVGGGPALWASGNGGSAWARVRLTGAAALTLAGTGALAGITHGAAGWLAVGTASSARAPARARPIVASSPDGRAWTVTGGQAALPGGRPGVIAAAAAAAPAGSYVIVGHQPAGGRPKAIAWYSPAPGRAVRERALRAGWRRAAISPRSGAEEMNAVTATACGFAAVGGSGAHPAAWLSAAGRTWRRVALPRPDGAAHAALSYVAASGATVVAVGTAVSPAGVSSPFAEISADDGARWRPIPLPRPAPGPGAAGPAAITVTTLTAAGGGFTATGTYGGPVGADVVVWTLPSAGLTGDARTGDGWTAVTPQGTGLAGPGTQAITALTAEGATLTGVGFTARSGERQPTLWQSPIRG